MKTNCRRLSSLLRKAMVSTEDSDERKKRGVSESKVSLLQSRGSVSVESGGLRVCNLRPKHPDSVLITLTQQVTQNSWE